MKTISIVLFALGYLGSLAFALKLLLAKSYFPYHQQVTGKPWNELDEGVRIIIRSLLQLVGAGVLAGAGAGAWMTWLFATGPGIPAVLIALPGIVIGAVTFAITTRLIRNGGTGAPRLPVAVLTLVILAGAIAGLLAG